MSPQTPVQRDAADTFPQRIAIIAAEDARAPSPEDLERLVTGSAAPDAEIQRAAIRALGRLERRDLVTTLLPRLRDARALVRADAAFAIAQSMRGEKLPLDIAGSQVEGVLGALAGALASERDPSAVREIIRSIARLPDERAEQVNRAEILVRQVLTLSNELSIARGKQGRLRQGFDAQEGGRAAAAGGVAAAELLARLHFKLSPPSDDLIASLRSHVKGQAPGVSSSEAPPPAAALQALVAARGVDQDTLVFSLQSQDDHLRRIAVTLLGGGASPISGPDRAAYLRKAMSDSAFFVRYEAVRSYARTHAKSDGCAPLTDTLNDSNPHVALAAIDAVGEACRGDDVVTLRMVSEARTPPSKGSWHREAHALVALARLSPTHAEIPLRSQARHPVWQVRMYAARAAAVLDDVQTLERLAEDDNDNVREATLAPLKRLKGNAAQPHFIAALARGDYQLLLTAATESKGLGPSRALTVALTEALRRVTAHRKETSRDTRLALVQRLREIGTSDVHNGLISLLRDFDPKVAAAAADAMTALTAGVYSADPQLLPLQALPTAAEIATLKSQQAVLVMETGKNIELQFDPDVAPMTAVRFLRLSNENYFDGLTFHRVVPNFVVQGGSPRANEYSGDGPFLRDELSTRSHTRGTIGLSTRGRDTGDAQIFFNLVDNPRLDFDYTIFGDVSGTSLTRMYEILEGDVIRDVRWVPRESQEIRR